MINLATIGILGSGNIGRKLAKQFIQAGNKVIMSNHHGPDSLKNVIKELGPSAKAGTIAEAEQQNIVLLAVLRPALEDVLSQNTDWSNQILIDATNEIPTQLAQLRGSELVEHLAPGAHVIKAFNTLFARYMTGTNESGRRVLFFAGDDDDSKQTCQNLFVKMRYSPVDLGTIKEAGPLMEFGAPLSGTHFVEVDE
ncbi:hypothetical protein FD16_GL000726 [Paucilactobacillus suebicus DSM 5007 = KCTC 3549]|uniref:Pyrroline-5-carboxylate reductase catalytic N-terminal domain-containing protein n=1 Tax=Paucilactobacillus suebicus DSM 5007 = KCTC 3549 TaxID=1423807 RepID=A0A0R1W871_9LACO|nr:hypothetical protein FD16_GL000726 [Paucilactobacillus suebicus DSM 5007 = KCTC 3549]